MRDDAGEKGTPPAHRGRTGGMFMLCPKTAPPVKRKYSAPAGPANAAACRSRARIRPRLDAVA